MATDLLLVDLIGKIGGLRIHLGRQQHTFQRIEFGSQEELVLGRARHHLAGVVVIDNGVGAGGRTKAVAEQQVEVVVTGELGIQEGVGQIHRDKLLLVGLQRELDAAVAHAADILVLIHDAGGRVGVLAGDVEDEVLSVDLESGDIPLHAAGDIELAAQADLVVDRLLRRQVRVGRHRAGQRNGAGKELIDGRRPKAGGDVGVERYRIAEVVGGAATPGADIEALGQEGGGSCRQIVFVAQFDVVITSVDRGGKRVGHAELQLAVARVHALLGSIIGDQSASQNHWTERARAGAMILQDGHLVLVAVVAQIDSAEPTKALAAAAPLALDAALDLFVVIIVLVGIHIGDWLSVHIIANRRRPEFGMVTKLIDIQHQIAAFGDIVGVGQVELAQIDVIVARVVAAVDAGWIHSCLRYAGHRAVAVLKPLGQLPTESEIAGVGGVVLQLAVQIVSLVLALEVVALGIATAHLDMP